MAENNRNGPMAFASKGSSSPANPDPQDDLTPRSSRLMSPLAELPAETILKQQLGKKGANV